MNIFFSLNSKTPVEIEQMIAGNIRRIRKRRRISQKELSQKAGVSLGSVKRFEQKGDISLFSLVKIAIALEIQEELEHLFEKTQPLSIEEIINEQD